MAVGAGDVAMASNRPRLLRQTKVRIHQDIEPWRTPPPGRHP